MSDVVKENCAYCGCESEDYLCRKCRERFDAGKLAHCTSCGELQEWGSMISTNHGGNLCGDCQSRTSEANYEPEPKSLFPLGRVAATPGALEELEKAKTTPTELLTRHAQGDWGDLSKEDLAENELSLKEGFRILSAYKLSTGVKVWVITEADRSATTILLPSEY